MRVRVLRGARRLGVLQFVVRKGECTQGSGLDDARNFSEMKSRA